MNYKFTIDTHNFPILHKAIEENLKFFNPNKVEGVEVKYTDTKVVVTISEMYCYVCNLLLGLKRKYPERFKAGKKASKWLDEYRRISRF